MDLQFGGYTIYSIHLSYPSQTLNLPIYPFFTFRFKEMGRTIFDIQGKPKGLFYDRSNKFNAGMGFLMKNFANLKLSYFLEYMNITSNMEHPVAEYFPSWKQKLSGIHEEFILDLLDELKFPTTGVYIKLQGEKNIERFSHYPDYF